MSTAEEFQRDPFLFLDRALPDAGATLRLSPGELLLTEAQASKSVLANADGRFEEHSDFFHTRRGYFGPRALQVEIGRSVMKVLYAQLHARAALLPETIEQELGRRSEWPDAGNWLLYRHLAPALAGPRRSEKLRRRIDRIVERAVLAGARERHSFVSRAIFRFQVLRELAAAIEADRRDSSLEEPDDALAVLAISGRPETAGRAVPAKELAEVFLSVLFAVSGSIGFTLAWSLYHLGRAPSAAPPACVVREALRLHPVAWFLGRKPAGQQQVAGAEVGADDAVIVCPYAVHRNPRHWDDADVFRPERWQGIADPEAFIPFGWGPHKCVGATFSLRLVEDILRVLAERYRWNVAFGGDRPQLGAALAPPRFTLELEKLSAT